MSLLAPKSRPRVLLVIAPDLYQCHRTAIEHGLVAPAIENYRNVTRAYGLRGLLPGTPFITFGREHWGDWPHGRDLDAAVAAYTRTGHLRIAQPADLAASRLHDGVPFRADAPRGLGVAP